MTWLILTFTAMFFIAIEMVYEKKTLTKAKSLDFAALFAFGNFLLSLPLIFIIDFSKLNPLFIIITYLASLVATGTSYLAFKTIKHNQISETACLISLLPLIVTLFAFVFLGERVSPIQLGGILLIVLGMVFLEIKNYKFSSGIFKQGRSKYIYFILLYLFLGGFSATFDRYLLFNLKFDVALYLFFIQAFIAFNFMIFFLFKPTEREDLKENALQFWKIILVISALTVTHRYLHGWALQIASSAGVISAIYRLSSLIHVYSGGKFFQEDEIGKKAIASIIIIGGTTLLLV